MIRFSFLLTNYSIHFISLKREALICGNLFDHMLSFFGFCFLQYSVFAFRILLLSAFQNLFYAFRDPSVLIVLHRDLIFLRMIFSLILMVELFWLPNLLLFSEGLLRKPLRVYLLFWVPLCAYKISQESGYFKMQNYTK